ncbi:g288 [Yersinia phage phiR1-37]|nr:hypothetical protein phiR1-37_gp288 [Yersinia phage phiR1-37]CCE26311.1 g288 [Yersinia phage phiR1-37]
MIYYLCEFVVKFCFVFSYRIHFNFPLCLRPTTQFLVQ